MADRGQWAKLWCSAEDDPDLSALSLEDFGRWCKLLIYLKRHGTEGRVVFKKNANILREKFRCKSDDEVISVLQSFPNCTVEEKRNDVAPGVTALIVTFSNWNKYQGDNSAERTRRWRERVTPKKRREEKRKEEKTTAPLPPPGERQRRKKSDPNPAMQFQESWATEPWPSVRRFVAEHNARTPDWWPAVRTLDDTVTEKVKEYLKRFPEQAWWNQVFANIHRGNRWMREYHNKSLGWLLQRGKEDRIANCLKTHDGKYLEQS